MGNQKPTKQHSRRTPIHLQSEADRQVESMLQNNIIQPSDRSWLSPILLAKTKHGTVRFCVDNGKINVATIKDADPFPRISQTLDSQTQTKWFSTLDLASGYWQWRKPTNVRQRLLQDETLSFGCDAVRSFKERKPLRATPGKAGLHGDVCLI